MTTLKTPALLKDEKFTEVLKVHGGFKGKILGGMHHFSYTNRLHGTLTNISLARTEYLFDEKAEADNLDQNLDKNVDEKGEKHKKYGKILHDLKECYNFMEDGKKVHEGFSLYVTGHRCVRATLCSYTSLLSQ